MSAATAPATNGNGNGRLWKALGIPGAIAAVLAAAISFHTVVASPAIERGSRAAVKELLESPQFWAQVREVARKEADASVAAHERVEAAAMDVLTKAAADREARLRELERRR